IAQCLNLAREFHHTASKREFTPSRSTEKSWPNFRPSAVDFCGSRLAIGAATERARAVAMPAGTRAPNLQKRVLRRAAFLTPGGLPPAAPKGWAPRARVSVPARRR